MVLEVQCIRILAIFSSLSALCNVVLWFVDAFLFIFGMRSRGLIQEPSIE